MTGRGLGQSGWVLAIVLLAGSAFGGEPGSGGDSQAVAAEVDRLILADLKQAGLTPAPRCSDVDFLRRVSLDITGQLPSPESVTLFAIDPDPAKRSLLVERLLTSPEYGRNWARYWRDVIYMPATQLQARFSQGEFEDWMTEQLNTGRTWDAIATEMLTATGEVRENPQTALLMAQGAQAAEVAAEASRIFLGIQMQCANCHDHPTDSWKREQFHELAAYFPRISLRRMQEPRTFEVVSVNTDRGRGDFMRSDPERFVRMLDRNRDGKLSRDEMRGPMSAAPPFLDRLFEMGDTNKDGGLSLEEIKALPVPDQARAGSTEHFMPDLNDPASRGRRIDPRFFLDGSTPGTGLTDEERRAAVARAFTSPDNPWFARAIVNRMWCEFLGEGFAMPVDDLGPNRSARFPQAFDALAAGLVANGYDVKWLVRTIANSQTYQRQVAPRPVSEESLPFAAVTPTRLRADVVYNALLQTLGIQEPANEGGRGMMAGPRAYQRGMRFQFDFLFGVDPSVPKDDITGNVPQSLFLMNSSVLRGALSASNGRSRLGQIVRTHTDDDTAISELYLLVLAREPSAREQEICRAYLREVESRNEAYEDLMWSLLNSSEFLSKR